MVLNDWEAVQLREIASISSGGTPSRKNIAFWNGEIPWVTTAEVDFCTIFDTAQKITALGLKNSSAKLYPAGTLLLAMYGQGKTRGKVAKLGIEASTNQACAAIQLGGGSCSDFYFQYLQFKYKNIRSLSNSGGQDNLSGSIVQSITVARPTLAEQKKIAQILSTWDKAITTTEQLLANSQQQKKALMQQLLTGKRRLPGFCGEWKESELGEVFSERVDTGNDDLPLLSITANEGVIHRAGVGRKDTSNADKAKYRRICPGDIGYNTMRMWQGVSGYSQFEGIVSPAYTIVTPNKAVNVEYASTAFKTPKLIHRFYRHSQGMVSDTWNLKYPHFAKVRWIFPPIEEQKAIASIFRTVNEQISLLRLEVERLSLEKKALLQQLLTGKRRVTIDEATA